MDGRVAARRRERPAERGPVHAERVEQPRGNAVGLSEQRREHVHRLELWVAGRRRRLQGSRERLAGERW